MKNMKSFFTDDADDAEKLAAATIAEKFNYKPGARTELTPKTN